MSMHHTVGTAWSAAIAAALLSTVIAGAVPTEQQAIVQSGVGGPEVLTLQSVPVLRPSADAVLIRVIAAGVNPLDWKLRQGLAGPPRGSAAGAAPQNVAPSASAQRVPGAEVAGVVVATGDAVRGIKVGRPVFAILNRGSASDGLNGGYSQYVLAPAAFTYPKPSRMTFDEAAGLGITGITAARVVAETGVKRGDRVLITGVAGGVGSATAQVVVAQRAQVIGTASARHAEFLKNLGVSRIVDYTDEHWEDMVKDVDVAIDTVGGDTATAAVRTLRKGGTFISVVRQAVTQDQCNELSVRCLDDFSADARRFDDATMVRQLTGLVNRGQFRVHIDKRFSIEQAAEAQEYNRQGHTEGKVVIEISPGEGSKR